VTTSEAGVQALTTLEAIRLAMYPDAGGKPTIGVGHLLTPDELASGMLTLSEPDSWRDGLTGDQVRALLRQDLADAEQVVTDSVTVPLAQHQFDALVSFVFNIGGEKFRDSTLLRQLNAGDYASIPAQLRQWIHVGETENAGLRRRRELEVHLWEGATS